MISKICNWIGRIPHDKVLHYFISYLIFDICLSLCLHYNVTTWLSIVISVFIVSIAIFAKEIVDKTEYNGWNWLDILAGYLGVITKLSLFLVEIM